MDPIPNHRDEQDSEENTAHRSYMDHLADVVTQQSGREIARGVAGR